MEIAILNWIQDTMTSPALTVVMKFFSTLGNNGMIWILFILLLFIKKETRRFGLIAAGALILEVLLCNIILKPIVARPRPFDEAEVILAMIAPTDYSFPSGHAGSAFAVATALCFWNRRAGVCALILAALIAFSRLYLYVHYPSDVLAGLLIGVVCAFAALGIAKWIEKKWAQRQNSAAS